MLFQFRGIPKKGVLCIVRSHLQPGANTSALSLGSTLGNVDGGRPAARKSAPATGNNGNAAEKVKPTKKTRSTDKAAEAKVKEINGKVGDIRTLLAKLNIAPADQL